MLPIVYAQHGLYGKWARKTGLISNDYQSSMAVSKMLIDKDGNVYICGSSSGVVSFSDNTCTLTQMPGYDGSGSYVESINDRLDGYITKYDALGKWVWTTRVTTGAMDQCADMCLSPDGTKLAFKAAFGYVTVSGVSTGTSQIIYGNGVTEGLPMNPLGPWGNMAVVILNTSDGSKVNFIDFGATNAITATAMGNVYTVDDYFCVQYLYKPASSYLLRILKYDFWGNIQGSAGETVLSNQGPAYFNITSSKNTGADSYTSTSVVRTTDNGSGTGGRDWYYDQNLYKIDNNTKTASIYSHISVSPPNTVNTHRYGIQPKYIELNSNKTHLFLVGNTEYSFTYTASAGLGTVTNAGLTDGIIVCYDPSKSDVTTGHIRWVVNLRAAGTQMITDAVYDENASVLRICGYIGETSVNFNPRGTAMNYQASSGSITAAFYAVYDENGICQNVTILDGINSGSDQAQGIVQLSSDEIVIYGSFSGFPFPVDPAGKINPLRSVGISNFIAKYSLTEQEADNPFESSFSAADKIITSYENARHDIQPCLTLGTNNTSVSYTEAQSYAPVNYKGGIVNPNYDGFESMEIGTGNPANGITAKIKVINSKESSAYLAGWIDFNQNGIFDNGEVSNILKVAPNTNTLTSHNLIWILPEGVNPRFSSFMRIRLTSENMDGTWGAGDAADGEVEDYRVVFNFTIPANPHVRVIGKE